MENIIITSANDYLWLLAGLEAVLMNVKFLTFLDGSVLMSYQWRELLQFLQCYFLIMIVPNEHIDCLPLMFDGFLLAYVFGDVVEFYMGYMLYVIV